MNKKAERRSFEEFESLFQTDLILKVQRHSYEEFVYLLHTDMNVEAVKESFMQDTDLTRLEMNRLILSHTRRYRVEHLTRIADLYDQHQFYLINTEKRRLRMKRQTRKESFAEYDVQLTPLMIIMKDLLIYDIFDDLLEIKKIHDNLMRSKFNYVIKVEFNQMFDSLIGSYMNEMNIVEFIKICKDDEGNFTEEQLLKAMKSDDEDDS